MFPSTSSQETSGPSGNKTNCFPRGHALCVYYYHERYESYKGSRSSKMANFVRGRVTVKRKIFQSKRKSTGELPLIDVDGSVYELNLLSLESN